jgi:SpoVK/Ycf46/Vps4 family AAA+-type ATPase
MNQKIFCRWTRDGLLHFNWNSYESFESLILVQNLREKITKRVQLFREGKEIFQSARLSWRYGYLLFGQTGTGKTAATRAIARFLEWDYFTIPAHEILDSHLLERALAEVIQKPHRVIVLEDVDQMIERMEPEVFFCLIDHAMERAEGTFWIATTRHAENTPKTQMIRPGRFDESIRFDLPSSDLRKELLARLLPEEIREPNEAQIPEYVSLTEGLTFAHFEELRQIVARMRLEKIEAGDFLPVIKSYIEDQLIGGDRLGGLSDQTMELRERVRQVDSRVLASALDMTDVFRTLMEKVIGDAAEQAKKGEVVRP